MIYTDESGNVDIEAAVNDGEMHEVNTVTDEESGNSQTVYGTEGVQTAEDAVANGDVTQEEVDDFLNDLANW